MAGSTAKLYPGEDAFRADERRILRNLPWLEYAFLHVPPRWTLEADGSRALVRSSRPAVLFMTLLVLLVTAALSAATVTTLPGVLQSHPAGRPYVLVAAGLVLGFLAVVVVGAFVLVPRLFRRASPLTLGARGEVGVHPLGLTLPVACLSAVELVEGDVWYTNTDRRVPVVQARLALRLPSGPARVVLWQVEGGSTLPAWSVSLAGETAALLKLPLSRTTDLNPIARIQSRD